MKFPLEINNSVIRHWRARLLFGLLTRKHYVTQLRKALPGDFELPLRNSSTALSDRQQNAKRWTWKRRFASLEKHHKAFSISLRVYGENDKEPSRVLCDECDCLLFCSLIALRAQISHRGEPNSSFLFFFLLFAGESGNTADRGSSCRSTKTLIIYKEVREPIKIQIRSLIQQKPASWFEAQTIVPLIMSLSVLDNNKKPNEQKNSESQRSLSVINYFEHEIMLKPPAPVRQANVETRNYDAEQHMRTNNKFFFASSFRKYDISASSRLTIWLARAREEALPASCHSDYLTNRVNTASWHDQL